MNSISIRFTKVLGHSTYIWGSPGGAVSNFDPGYNIGPNHEFISIFRS